MRIVHRRAGQVNRRFAAFGDVRASVSNLRSSPRPRRPVDAKPPFGRLLRLASTASRRPRRCGAAFGFHELCSERRPFGPVASAKLRGATGLIRAQRVKAAPRQRRARVSGLGQRACERTPVSRRAMDAEHGSGVWRAALSELRNAQPVTPLRCARAAISAIPKSPSRLKRTAPPSFARRGRDGRGRPRLAVDGGRTCLRGGG